MIIAVIFSGHIKRFVELDLRSLPRRPDQPATGPSPRTGFNRGRDLAELPGQVFHASEQLLLFRPVSFLIPGHDQHYIKCVNIVALVLIQQDHRPVELRLTGFPVTTQTLQIAQIGKSGGINIIL